MTISLIAAVSENNVIGRNNDLPWHLPADLKYFKEKTMGHCVVMGRKNFESIPNQYRPLSGRTNIVITHQKDYDPQGAYIVHSIDEAVEIARGKGEKECFIIGGGEIFMQSIQRSDKIYLTRIHHSFQGNIFFPEIKKDKWIEISRQDFKADEKNSYDFSIIELEKVK